MAGSVPPPRCQRTERLGRGSADGRSAHSLIQRGATTMTIRTGACVRGGAHHERPSRGGRRSWTPTLVVHLIVMGLAVLTLSPVVPAAAAGPWQGQVLDA